MSRIKKILAPGIEWFIPGANPMRGTKAGPDQVLDHLRVANDLRQKYAAAIPGGDARYPHWRYTFDPVAYEALIPTVLSWWKKQPSPTPKLTVRLKKSPGKLALPWHRMRTRVHC